MIDIGIFKGEVPRVADKLLPVEYASSAINCDLESGNLQPLKGVSSVQDVGATCTSIYKMSTSYLQWAANVNVVKSLVADSGNRILISGDGYPKETNASLAIGSGTYPSATRRLGIPAPTNALTVTLNGTAGEDIVHSSSYVYTIVGEWADGSVVESAPSVATDVFDVYSDITPRLTGFVDATATGVYTTHFRIYRLNSGTTGAEYQYVDDIAVTETYLDDTVLDADLGEVLPTTYWTAPESTLTGLIATSHGLVFGFDGNTIYPSEIFIPYAYPSIYSLVTESDIVGLGYTGSLVVVLTETVPYMLIGQEPETLSLRRLGHPQSCVAARSIVNIPGGVVYASPDGLYKIDESGLGTLVTRNVMTKEQWKALIPANLIGFLYDEYYIGFFSGTTAGFSLNLNSGEYKTIAMTQNVYGGTYSPESDLLYLIQAKSSVREIVSWQSGSDLDYTWISKIFTSTVREVYTACKVCGTFTAGSVTLSFYVDGVLGGTKVVTSDSIFRINIKGCTSFHVKAVGKATIDRILVGGSVNEIVEILENV